MQIIFSSTHVESLILRPMTTMGSLDHPDFVSRFDLSISVYDTLSDYVVVMVVVGGWGVSRPSMKSLLIIGWK